MLVHKMYQSVLQEINCTNKNVCKYMNAIVAYIMRSYKEYTDSTYPK